MLGPGLQRSNQGQFERLLSLYKSAGSHRSLHLGQPRRPALLYRFDGNGVPFGDQRLEPFRPGLLHDTFRQQRYNPGDSKFGGFLNYGFEKLPFGQSLQESRLAGQGSNAALLDHPQNNFLALSSHDFAAALEPCAVEHNDLLPGSEAKDLNCMMGFAAGQYQRWSFALLGRQIKTVHNPKTTGYWNSFLAFSKKVWVRGFS